MQKKIKFRLAEFLFVLICLSGSTLSVWKFWGDLNQSLFKQNEKPIATISFKYKTAQRRFIDDVIWDRLRQESPVYEGDTIRTAPLSEATIYFSDGNIMDLHENTMARIFLREEGAEIDFETGQISVQANNSNVKIKSGSSVVDVNQGGQVAASQIYTENTQQQAFQVQVSKGNASLVSSAGEVALTEGGTASLDETGAIKKTYLTVASPVNDARYLNLKNEDFIVTFFWRTELEKVMLELFDSKDMASATETFYYSGTNVASIKMPAGVHWWKMSVDTPDGETEFYTGKVTIIQSGAPNLIAPAAEYEARYRTKAPSTRFIWTESERATSYQFEVSKNADMSDPIITQRSSQTSSIVSSLDAGTYYWRVIPYFVMNGIGLSAPSQISSFRITKSGALSQPNLQLPLQNSLVSTKVPLENGEVSYKSIHFSWKDNPEAVKYKIRVWPEGSNANGTAGFTSESSSNYFEIDTSRNVVENGKWFWQVTTYDVEGNYSVSDTREFFAMDSDVEQRTIFPPDNYLIAESRVVDTRFIWKTNLPFDSEFQISRDSRFRTSDIVYTEKTSATSVTGRQLPVGNYYWRIVTDVGGTKIQTAAKRVSIAPPLAAPVLKGPTNGSRAILLPETPLEFSWNKVSDADYYQIKIFAPENPDAILYDRNFIESKDGKIVIDEVDMQDFEERGYSWTVQAFREETISSSRQSGYLTSGNFVLKKLTPIKLEYPATGQHFDGIEMVKNPDVLKWNSVYEGEPVEVVLYKNGVAKRNLVGTYSRRGLSMKMPVLYEGAYYWTVKGTAEGDLDISSQETRMFTVGAIPKLSAATNLNPNNQVFNTDYFRSNRTINLKWNSVKEASRYSVKVYDSKGKIVTGQEYVVRGTSLVIEDLTAFQKGAYTWTVEAQSEYNGALFQNGEIAKGGFEIDLPVLNKLKVNNGGKLYGK